MFLGLTDLADEGQFLWKSDYSAPLFPYWNAGAPNNGGQQQDIIGDEDCVEMLGAEGLKWNDAECTHSERHAICQKYP